MTQKSKTFLAVIGAVAGLILIVLIVKVGSALSQPREFSGKYSAKEQECGTKPVLLKSGYSGFGGSGKFVIVIAPDNARYGQTIKDYENLKNPGPALMNLLFGPDQIVGLTCTLDQARSFEVTPGTKYVEDPQNGIKAAQQTTANNFKNLFYLPKAAPEGYKISKLTFPTDGSYYNFEYAKPSETSTTPDHTFSFICLKAQINPSLIDGQYTARPVIQRNVFYTRSGLKSKYLTYFWTQQQTTGYTEYDGITLLEQGQTDYVIQVDNGLICMFKSGTYKVPETAALIDSITLIDNFAPDNYTTQISDKILPQ